LKNTSNQITLSDGWYKYFGFCIPPEEIIFDGCMSENPKLIDTSCPVRPCVIARGYHNCSECPDMICEKLADRMVVYEEILEKMRGYILVVDYQRFIRPYENRSRLL